MDTIGLEQDGLLRLAQGEADYVTQCRRTLHRMAEVSGQEDRTSAFLLEEIGKAGLPVERVSAHGLIATLDTGRPGPHLALRADMDALPIQENPNNLAGPRVCVSQNPGVAHLCGHDAHAAMLLGAMRVLAARSGQLCGVLYFCFEEGEETGAGIDGMIAALERRRVDGCWAIHVYAALESGRISVDVGPRMAGASTVEITVTGRGGHGSRPDLSVNPVVCAAAIVSNVSALWPNRIAAGKTVTLGITSIQGGVQHNIIPDTARILGSLRFFDLAEGEKAIALFRAAAQQTAAMYGCTVEFGPWFRVAVRPVVNHPGCAALAARALAGALPAGAVAGCEPWYASEDFSHYCSRWPSVFALLGTKNEALGCGAEHHNEYFDVDEGVLPLGVAATLAYVRAVQGEGVPGTQA